MPIISREFVIILPKLGLVLNFVGTMMVCISIGKNRENTNQPDAKGNPVYLASVLHPCLFRWGLIIIALGFLLQLMA